MRLFKFTIKARLIVLYTVVFAVLLTLVSYGTIFVLERMFLARVDTYLIAYAQILHEKLPEYMFEGKFRAGELPRLSESELRELSRAVHLPRRHVFSVSDVRFQLVDSHGTVLVKDPVLSNAQRFRHSREVSPERISFLFLGIESGTYRMYRKRLPPVEKLPKEIADKMLAYFGVEKLPDGVILEVATSLEGLTELKAHIMHRQLLLVAIALFIAGLASYFIARYGFKPVTRMAKTAEVISATNLDQRLELPKARDEIHMLGETMNAMIDRIAEAFKSQQQFIADASHEIRTPLTIIQAELELALKKIKDPDARDGIEVSLSELEHLAKLTHSLLTLARLDAPEPNLHFDDVRLDELLVECIQSFQGLARSKNIKLDISIADSVEIQGEREKLKKVFVNIIENAIKYSPEGRSVTVNLEKLEKQAHVRVEDMGYGISEKALPFIFNRFYRAPERRGEVIGSGLGLSIVKRIVELHHGEITINSKKDNGTIVSVTLPL